MIRYSLACEKEHDFEIWFKNSADYDKQAKRGLVTCPECGSAKVEKALMAPSLGRGAKKKGAHAPIAEFAAPGDTGAGCSEREQDAGRDGDTRRTRVPAPS